MVSVIIPTYNREKDVEKAICSVLKQTYQDFEIIIVDDRSTDGTENIIKQYLKKYKNIKYIKNERNGGPANARNVGIMNANGEYIAFLDSDDVWLECHLQESLDAMKKYGANAGFAYWYEMQNGETFKSDELSNLENKILEAEKEGVCTRNTDVVIFHNKYFEYNILKPTFFYHINTVILERQLVDKIGLFNETLKSSEDIDFIYRILCYGKFILIRNYHFIYCEGNDNLYHFENRSQIRIEDVINDKQLVKKFSRDGIYKNKMREERIRLVKKAPAIDKKKECILHIRKSMAKKYRTIAFFNSLIHKKIAFHYYLKAYLSYPSINILFLSVCLLLNISVKVNDKKRNWFELS